jgi:putative Ca2+/H+ antiporter (TMEM165/GDT1 family)
MYEISLPLILSTFGIIFIAELPDKTAIASLVLGTRYKTSHVIFGTWLALLVQTVVAVLAGSLLTLLPNNLVHIVSGLGFLVFAYIALARKEDEEEKKEEEDVAIAQKKQRAAWLTSFLVVFAAEWGDLTQLATAALVAHNGHGLSIGIGALAAPWAVSLIATLVGSQLTRFIDLKKLSIASGVLFGVIGIVLLASAFGF